MNSMGSGGNGELTREVLRAELKAGLGSQENKFRQMLDDRLRPINEHISRIDRGELNTAQQNSIIRVVQNNADADTARSQLKVPLFALLVSVATLFVMIMFTLVGGHVV